MGGHPYQAPSSQQFGAQGGAAVMHGFPDFQGQGGGLQGGGVLHAHYAHAHNVVVHLMQ